ncbi:hypothetical protein MDA_GLEAN10001856 [Myotis davidii]|uniref:Uncharacterized protein n=1 Tax=Myotis davidii TaxID=225400 RepID=L5M8P3_MYODS|nr:hypothetical protein MDA_GLEAN10001856 [Myotis davidii]
MTLLFLVGCIFFPLIFALLCWGLQSHSSLRMPRPEAVLVASNVLPSGKMKKECRKSPCPVLSAQ